MIKIMLRDLRNIILPATMGLLIAVSPFLIIYAARLIAYSACGPEQRCVIVSSIPIALLIALVAWAVSAYLRHRFLSSGEVSHD